MNLPVATRMTIRFKDLQGMNTFSKAYHTAVNQRLAKIKRALTQSQLQNPASDTALLKPTYTWQTRVDLPGFQAYGESSNRIAAIANVFPLFFFLIAALITFTTVTRMIEEARTEIGTLKALAFPNGYFKELFDLRLISGEYRYDFRRGFGASTIAPLCPIYLYQLYFPQSGD